MGKSLGYARVSTLEQNAELQQDALSAAECWKVFTDHVSGAKEDRPELGRVLEQLREGDTLVVVPRPAGPVVAAPDRCRRRSVRAE